MKHFTLMTMLCALSVAMPAMASDWLPLPQSVQDLNPVVRKDVLPSAHQVKVPIPDDRLGRPLEKSASVLRLAPGQSQTVALSRDAASVVVANPAHASVFLDNPRLMVIVPRATGATSFTVLDNKGETILTQQLVVNEMENKSYVRVTRICDAAGGNAGTCAPTTVYYCPDNCVPVAVQRPDPNAVMPTIPPIASMPSLPDIGQGDDTGTN